MIYKDIMLSEKYPEASLTVMVCDNDLKKLCNKPRQAVIVCPGGGYEYRSVRESEPIAKVLFGEGFNVFILNYSVSDKATGFAPMIEASLAIMHVREHAQEYNVDPSQIYIMGFSAGGHLAGAAGTMWNSKPVLDALGDIPYGANRPDGMILCYAVTSGVDNDRSHSIARLIGHRNNTYEELAMFSLEYYVNKDTSPAFIWHTYTDEVVPISQAKVLVKALEEHDISYELHVFPEGCHGLALANHETSHGDPKLENPSIAIWMQLAINWMRNKLN